jgi:hypothetical protein
MCGSKGKWAVGFADGDSCCGVDQKEPTDIGDCADGGCVVVWKRARRYRGLRGWRVCCGVEKSPQISGIAQMEGLLWCGNEPADIGDCADGEVVVV